MYVSQYMVENQNNMITTFDIDLDSHIKLLFNLQAIFPEAIPMLRPVCTYTIAMLYRKTTSNDFPGKH